MRRLHGDGAGRGDGDGGRASAAEGGGARTLLCWLRFDEVPSQVTSNYTKRIPRRTDDISLLFFFIASNKVMVVISIGPYKERSPKQIDSVGQRARFKVKPQKVGYIVQSIRAFAFLDESR